MKPLPVQFSAGGWPAAVALLERWLAGRGRVDALLDEVDWGESGDGSGPAPAEATERARCQHLFYGAVRHLERIERALGALVQKRPRTRLRAVLVLGAYELLEAAAGAGEAGSQPAKIVHHAVGQAKTLVSPAEARLVNAVLRRFAALPEIQAAAPDAGAGAGELARFFSHPEWLVRRWIGQFGLEPTRALLRWNQTPAPVYARWRALPAAGEPPSAPPAFLQPTAWPGFFLVPAGVWPEVARLLGEGALYLQDPATLLAPTLLGVQAGETVADCCAAPGGKSLLLADQLAAAGPGPARVLAIDLPEARRIARLRTNLARARGVETIVIESDLLQLTPELLRARGLPERFSAVLLDAPCSNTGVMRHRVDVKWRLREGDVARLAERQRALLGAAAALVAPGGRLVYSTCSLEPEENEEVVADFVDAAPAFALEESRLSRPWETGCDGAGAFRLRRRAG